MGFSNLPALIYLLSIPVLIYIYYFSRKKKRVEISSIIPWRLLKESVIASSLFRADLLFYVQLLGLLVLVLAACRPYWEGGADTEHGRDIFIVMDRSASMQALEGRKSRWQLACERVVRLLRGLGEGDRVTLIGAGARPEILALAGENRVRLEEAVRQAGPVDTPDRLAPAVEMAFSMMNRGNGTGEENFQGGASELYIFTDRSRESLGVEKIEEAGSARIETVGSPKENRAITSLSVYRNPFSPEQAVSGYVTVENFSRHAFSGSLRVLDQGKEVESKAVRLEPGEELTTGISGKIPEGVFEVVLEPPDSLRVDNRAYALNKAKRVTRIALFTRDLRWRQQFSELVKAIPNTELDIFRPGDYEGADVGSYALAVFHHCEPREAPGVDMLIICPPVKSRIVRVLRNWVSGVSFLDWDEGHPVGENLRGLQNVSPGGSRVIDAPSWARPVVVSATASGDVPLVLCGEFEGRRVAVTGFDMNEIELKESGSMPALLLLLNLLNWLVEDSGNQVKTGEPYEAFVPLYGRAIEKSAEGEDATSGSPAAGEGIFCTVIGPRGREETASVGPGGRLVYAGTGYAGRYLVDGELAGRSFVANLFNREESDLLGETGGGEDRIRVKGAAPVTIASRMGNDRTNLFLFMLAMLLLTEWILYVAQRRGWLRTVKD